MVFNNSDKKITIGKLGEEIAKTYLKNKGYIVVTANYKVRGGEIDIVCQKPGRLFFVEVKTRSNLHFGYPEEAFNGQKKERFLKAADRYLRDKDYYGPWQIDLIAIELNLKKKSAKLRHYQAL